MAVLLAPMTDARMADWLVTSRREYAESRQAAGETPEQARAAAAASLATYFPKGRPLEPHRVFDLVADGAVVGALWVGPHPQTPDGGYWWVYNVEVDEEHRGQGYGRAAMLLAEDVVRREGGTMLGLNVFGWNTTARRLYESLGYGTMSMQMRKDLPPAED
ncbi:MAG TPA: GNAT family N-acetyltransferase [Naasia sp.]|jgi:ribosomal protein S18 acetylase RimI-like enzyme